MPAFNRGLHQSRKTLSEANNGIYPVKSGLVFIKRVILNQSTKDIAIHNLQRIAVSAFQYMSVLLFILLFRE